MASDNVDVRTSAAYVSKLVEIGKNDRSSVAKGAIEALGRIHRAEAMPAATCQEILDGFEACLEAKEDAAMIQASVELGELGAAAAGAALKLVELGRTSQRSDVAKALAQHGGSEAAVKALGKIHRAETTPTVTRQEILVGFLACLEAKEDAAIIQASMDLGALGAAAADATLKLVELGRTSQRSDVAKAAIEALGKIHRAEATLAATRQEILDGFVVCLEAKEHAAVIQASVELGTPMPRPRPRAWKSSTVSWRASRRRSARPCAMQASVEIDAPGAAAAAAVPTLVAAVPDEREV